MNEHDNEQMIQEKMKKLLGELPKPELSEGKSRKFIARLYNIAGERKSIPEAFPVKRIASFSGAGAVLVTLILALNYYFSPLYPTVANVEGTVKIYRADKNVWVFAERPRIKLYKNDILKTFENSRADLVIPGVYHMRLKSSSEMRLCKSVSRGSRGDIGYALDKGAAFAYYDKKRKIGGELGIKTPQALATALGTDFMVESSPLLSRTWVGVMDGVVKVSGLEEMNAVLVRAGEKTIVHTGSAPQKPARLMEKELLNMEELYNIGVRPQVALLISTGPTRARELLAMPILYISSEKSGAFLKKIEKIVNEFNRAIKEGSKEKHIENIKRMEEIVNDYPNSKYDVQFLLFAGAYYEYAGEDGKAIATFERVVSSYPDSGLASIAQCAIGIIYEEKLKDIEKAKAAYKKVISNYPQSPEMEEAQAALGRLTR